jgi:hypothetical protein
MCVITVIKPREIALLSCVLVLSSRHESWLSCPVCEYYDQATRVSGHVMCVSTIDLISVTLRSYIKPRELAVMSRVLGLSSSHES